MPKEDEGSDSEWNEGNLKSKRLDEIQELINYYKMDLMGMEYGRFKYVLYLKAVELLHGEGDAWYTSLEKEEIYRIKKLANLFIKVMSPHIEVIKCSLSGNSKSYLFNKSNYEILIDIIDKFELRVKDLNNQHGLSSKNRDDDEGL